MPVSHTKRYFVRLVVFVLNLLVLSAVALFGQDAVRYVDGGNSQRWCNGTGDFGAWVNCAIASLPVQPPTIGGSSYASGTIFLLPSAGGNPTGIPVLTTITVNSPMVRLIGTGSGSFLLSCQMTNGDCIRWYTQPFNQQQGAELSGMSLTGNGGNEKTKTSSGIHIGDLMSLKMTDIYIKSFTSTLAQDGMGSAGAVGLWVDNVNGFSERWQLDRVSLDGSIIQFKVTNSAAGCDSFSTSFSYWAMGGQINMRVYAGETGVEIGPGATTGHGNYAFQMNGSSNGTKTFFQMDSTAGSCTGTGEASGAAAMNNIRFSLHTEDTNNGGGTLLRMASGTSLSGECFMSHFQGSPAMTNALNGTLACQNYYGPTGNQLILDARTFKSRNEQANFYSDGTTIDSSLGFARGNVVPIDAFFSDIGSPGDCFVGSNPGDFCIRDSNTSNVIGLTVGPTPSLQVTNTGIKSAQGLQIFNTSTTCTTAATAGATCTTAAVSLPVVEPDTSYRVNCTGKGPTNVPTVVSTTNSSSSQFKITIAAITAAAASYSSFDCVVGHN